MMTIEQRLARVEQRLRYTRFGLICSVLLIISAALMAQHKPDDKPVVHDAIHTKRLLIIDDDGITRAELHTQHGLVMLNMFDLDGTSRCDVWLNKEGIPAIGQQDKQGRPRSVLTLENAGPELLFYDNERNVRLALSLTDGIGPVLRLDSERDHGGVTLGAAELTRKDGAKLTLPTGTLVLFDQDGNVTFKAPN